MTIATAICFSAVAILLWTWIVFPLLMVGIARLTPRRPLLSALVLPHVTVIVATRDELTAVRSRIEDLFAGDYPAEQLDVVLCIDAVTAAARKEELQTLAFPRLKVIVGDLPGGKASTINAGVRAARGDVLVFTDIQQRFEANAIRELVVALASDPRNTVAGGALYLPGDRREAWRSPVEWYWAGERLLRAAEARLHSSIGVSGSIYAIRATAWVPMPSGLILDDLFVPMQQVLRGRRVAYTLQARAWDVRQTNHQTERARKVRTLTGNFQLLLWLPTVLIPIKNPVFVQFISHKVLRLASPWIVGVAGLSLVASVVQCVCHVKPANVLALAAAIFAALVMPPLGQHLRALVKWMVAMNGALVQATINGLRGHWDVW